MELTPRVITPALPETDIVVLRVPYYGKPSQIYGKRVAAAVAKQYPLKKVRVVYDITARIGQNFTTKDPITNLLKSGVVYEATCLLCNDKYSRCQKCGPTFCFKSCIKTTQHYFNFCIGLCSRGEVLSIYICLIRKTLEYKIQQK
jgi:hypothetical protein